MRLLSALIVAAAFVCGACGSGTAADSEPPTVPRVAAETQAPSPTATLATTAPTTTDASSGEQSAAENIWVGDMFSSKGEWEKAAEAYTKAIDLEPTDAKTYLARGYAYARLLKVDLALADFAKAAELDPSVANIYARGVAYYGASKLDLAIADLTRVIELDPSFEYIARAHGLRAGARAQTSDATGANADFDRALSLTTDPAEITSIRRLRCQVGLGCA